MIVKPMVVDLTVVDWDTLELFEVIQEQSQAGERPRIRDLKRLVAGMFVDWTLEDAGKISQAESKQVLDALVTQLGNPPTTNDAPSPPPSSPADAPPSGLTSASPASAGA
jgi:hypothetical protein